MMAGRVVGWHAARQPLETMAFTVFKDCWHATAINEKSPSLGLSKFWLSRNDSQ